MQKRLRLTLTLKKAYYDLEQMETYGISWFIYTSRQETDNQVAQLCPQHTFVLALEEYFFPFP